MEILLCNLSKNNIKLVSREVSRGRWSFCKEKKRRMREEERGLYLNLFTNQWLGSLGLRYI